MHKYTTGILLKLFSFWWSCAAKELIPVSLLFKALTIHARLVGKGVWGTECPQFQTFHNKSYFYGVLSFRSVSFPTVYAWESVSHADFSVEKNGIDTEPLYNREWPLLANVGQCAGECYAVILRDKHGLTDTGPACHPMCLTAIIIINVKNCSLYKR